MSFIKNFKPQEFFCKCGCKTHLEPRFKDILDFHTIEGEYFGVDMILVNKLQRIRNYIEQPVIITSGLRCQKHNETLPKHSKNSSHLKGLAVDFYVKDMNKYRLEIINILTAGNFHRIGIGKDFIHFDIDPDKSQVSWTYD